MTKTANEVATLALRMLGVTPWAQAADAEEAAIATETYSAMLAELSEVEGFAWEFTADTTPDDHVQLLAGVLCGRLDWMRAADRQPVDARGYMRRLRALALPDDRTGPVDADYY